MSIPATNEPNEAKLEGWQRFKSSSLAHTLGHVAADAIVTAALLAALSAVHYVLYVSLVSKEFKHLFGEIHEYVFLGTYLLLAAKGMYRIART